MAVDLTLLKMHVDTFNKAKKHINEKKNAIIGTDVEAAFDTLKEHWRTGGFEPTEMSELVSIIKKNLKLFGSDRELQAELKSFSSMCEIYYTKDEDTFDAFQAVMQNKTPLDSSIIWRIYEKTFCTLQDYTEYDTIHKNTNGNTIYELFSFEPDTYKFRILKTLVDDKDEFRKYPLSNRGKWEDLHVFTDIFKDEQSKENYDAYYRFLRCKKILKEVHRRNKNLVSKNYLDIVGELEKYNICENSKQAEKLLVPFCSEIGLKCIPITAEEVAEHERRTESTRKRIEEIVNQLKTKQKELESSLKGIGDDIDSLFSSIDSLITDMTVKIKNIKNTSEVIYKEDDKIKELEGYIANLQKLKQMVKEVESSCLDTSTVIAKEVKNADDKQNEITFDNVNDIFNEVSSKDAVIRKRYKEFIDKYNNEIITKKVQAQVTESNSRFYNKENEINAVRERIKKRISHLNKPITRNFVLVQAALLFAFFFIYVPITPSTISPEKSSVVFFGLNSIGLICYIYFVIKQFNEYNQEQFKIRAEKRNYRYKKNLIWSIIFSCLSFAFLQLILLFIAALFDTTLQESMRQFYIGLLKILIIVIIVILILLYQLGKKK